MADTTDLVGDSWKYDPLYNKVADFIGVDKYDKEDIEVAQKISYVWDWAKARGKGESEQDVMWMIHKLRLQLGLRAQGKELLEELHKYLRLEQDTQREAKVAEDHRLEMQKIKEQAKIEQEKSIEISDEVIDQKVSEQIKDVQQKIKRKVKNQLTQTIQKGIQEALKKAVTL